LRKDGKRNEATRGLSLLRGRKPVLEDLLRGLLRDSSLVAEGGFGGDFASV
jgi:hypothetical protein